jgi:hypothetical protein
VLVAVGAMVLAGLISPAGPIDRTALRWHVLLWDLWFLVWGLLLGAAAWQYGRESNRRPHPYHSCCRAPVIRRLQVRGP